jgi:glutathione synthase
LPGLWSLDDLEDPATREVLAQAQSNPDDFVLKPQREGGGNNLYGQQLSERLQDKRGLAAYILMQRIRPPINR